MRGFAKVGVLVFSMLALALSSCDIVTSVDEIDQDGLTAELTAEDRCLSPWGGKHTFAVTLSGNVETILLGSDMTVVASAGEQKVNHWQWYLNDRPIRRADRSSVTVGSKLKEGRYKLSVIADKGNRIGFAKCFFTVVAVPPEPVSTFLEFDGSSWVTPTTASIPTFVPSDAIDLTFSIESAGDMVFRARSSVALLEGGALLEWDGAAWIEPFTASFPKAAPASTTQIIIDYFESGAFLARGTGGEWLQYDGSSWVTPYSPGVPPNLPADTIHVSSPASTPWYSLNASSTLSIYDGYSLAWQANEWPTLSGAVELVYTIIDRGGFLYIRYADGSFLESDLAGGISQITRTGVPTAFPAGTLRVLNLHFGSHFFALCRN
jgi:hypothetical protein